MAIWNIIEQDKSMFETFLYELCSLDEEDEYLLHHKFSNAITDTETHYICFVINYIMNRRQPFKFLNKNGMAYIAGQTKFNRINSISV